MKVTVILITLVNLGLSQKLNTGNETCAPGENCRESNETLGLVCEKLLSNRITDPSEVVYGNTNLIPNGFPHMAAIGYPSTTNEVDWLCSGTLITRKHVLTVAHCLEITDGRKAIWVRFGDNDLRNGSDDFNAQTLPVKKCYKYPNYNRVERYHDIGIIQMEGKVSLIKDVVETACLPFSSSFPTGETSVTDWGRLPNQDASAREQGLRRSAHQILAMESCNESFTIFSEGSRRKTLPQGLDEETMICAKALYPETASCAGSSGGPLQVQVNNTNCDFAVVGLSSFRFGCNRVDESTIYTKVYPYMSWIQDIVC